MRTIWNIVIRNARKKSVIILSFILIQLFAIHRIFNRYNMIKNKGIYERWDKRIDYNFLNKIIHLDLKGAPLSLYYLAQIIPIFSKLGVTGILIEYEDMFPYIGDIEIISRDDCYKEDDILQILNITKNHNIEIIPLVQTFGHLEFVLKHPQFSHLREVPEFSDTICPSKGESFQLIKKMIDQIVQLHPGIKSLHIGADEVYHMGKCQLCSKLVYPDDNRQIGGQFKDLSISLDEIFLNHILKIVRYMEASYPHIKILIWDDMFRHIPRDVLIRSKLGDKIELVMWNYRPNILQDIPPHIFDKNFATFRHIWAASAFKGATGENVQITDISYHLDNNYDWINVMYQKDLPGKETDRVKGIIVTGWQRYNHFRPLCELMPSGLPSLMACLILLTHNKFDRKQHEDLSSQITDSRYRQSRLIPNLNPFDFNQSRLINIAEGLIFPGHEIYSMVRSNYNLAYSLMALNTRIHENKVEDVDEFKSLLYNIKDEFSRQKSYINGPEFSKYFHSVSTGLEWIETFIQPYLDRIDHISSIL
ncbi:unnamed protein product [Gordionus sp. m RMFG-2023]|uniref:hexosaminidase D-like n=1 Tax=Gordionus sp. m RMFG-2023 TaxID=3053472 RepID=UPI0030E4FD95